MPERAASARLVVFGDVIDDVVVVPRGKVRPDTDTPASIRFLPGGSAANTAVWLGSVGASIDFVGRVGVADLARHEQLLRDWGVRPRLSADPALPTGSIVVLVDGDQRSMLTDRGANDALDPAEVTADLLAGAGLVHLTGHSLFGSSDPGAVTDLIRRALAEGAAVSVDPGSAGFLSDFGATHFLDAVAGATILLPSLAEGRLLTGLDDPVSVVRELGKPFPVVAMTMGAEGAVVVADGGEPESVPAPTVSVVDPTGAGDAFSAGFLHAWTGGSDAVAAAQAGAELAALAVSRMGARPE